VESPFSTNFHPRRYTYGLPAVNKKADTLLNEPDLTQYFFRPKSPSPVAEGIWGEKNTAPPAKKRKPYFLRRLCRAIALVGWPQVSGAE
jgi:hypothetical protein